MSTTCSLNCGLLVKATGFLAGALTLLACGNVARAQEIGGRSFNVLPVLPQSVTGGGVLNAEFEPAVSDVTTFATTGAGPEVIFSLDFETAPDGTPLNAADLDSAAGQAIDGTNFSTNNGNVGNLFSDLGVTITGSNGNPVGLFQTNCVPNGGSNSTFPDGPNCEPSNGDNDLATGNGFNLVNNVNFNTVPQGNAIILEENEGDGLPDDVGSGGPIVFDFSDALTSGDTLLESVLIGSITIVDDPNATLTFDFANGTTQVISISGVENNGVCEVGDSDGVRDVGESFITNSPGGIPDCLFNDGGTLVSAGDIGFVSVETLTIDFGSSGGIGEINFVAAPFEMEATAGVALLGLGAAWKLRRARKK